MKNSEGRRNSQEPKLRNQARKETLARSKEEEERNVSRYLGIKEPSATGGLDCFIDEGAFRAVAVCGAEVGTRWRRGRARARGATFTSPLATLFRTTVRDEWYNQWSRATPQRGRARR